jgi:hypothetical protein
MVERPKDRYLEVASVATADIKLAQVVLDVVERKQAIEQI